MHSQNSFVKALPVVCLFTVPVLLLYFNIIPIEQRFFVLLGFIVLLIGILFKERWNWKDLGIRKDNLSRTALPYLFFTLLTVSLTLILAKYLGKDMQSEWWLNPHFKYFILPVSAFQEFAYRGFLIPKLQNFFTSTTPVIILNAFLYAFLHIIFPAPFLMKLPQFPGRKPAGWSQ